MYVANEGNSNMQNACFGALVCKYWPLINKYYFLCNNVATQEDVYDWLIDSIQYALKHRRWEDPDSNIYQDPTGPDKVINRRMKCARLTFYQYINRKKRKDNFNIVQLEDMTSLNNTEPLVIPHEDEIGNLSTKLSAEEYIHDLVLKKEYFLAFMLDIIINEDIFDKEDLNGYVFNPKKLAKHLRYINEDYCLAFENKYHISENMYQCYKKYCKNLSSNLIYNKIEYNLQKLKQTKIFKQE